MALSAAACWQLISNRNNPNAIEFQSTLNLLVNYLERGRLFFWGEGALSQFLILIWMLERGNKRELASSLLLDLIRSVAERNSRSSENPHEDPYISPDECLVKIFGTNSLNDPSRRQVVESYSLFPMIMIAVRKGLREQLAELWNQFTDVFLTWFRPDAPEDALLWYCGRGREFSESFARPQSWKQLVEFAFRDDHDRVPKILQDDADFALLYSMVFQHRTQLSLYKHLESIFPGHL